MLQVSAKRAFEHFTQGIADWWPLSSQSLSEANARTVIFEAKVGGRVFEIDVDGAEREWGRVLECEVNAKLVFSWVLERPDLATEVEVQFEELGEMESKLTLIHRGWEHRPEGATWRANYNQGWDGVLDCYTARISA